MYVRAKKALGQHFLKDDGVAKRIVDSLIIEGKSDVLEIGPGTGVLTKHLLEKPQIRLEVAEIDPESIAALQERFPQLLYSLQQRDFLKLPLEKIFPGKFAVIGNFPYNISSQIFFKILEYKDSVSQIVCMLQREVAQRLTSNSGTKAYGILSVLLQAWYETEYLFTVDESLFLPPPKVKSGVIRLTRNKRKSLGCDYTLFKTIVKSTFNQRRKQIANSLKPLFGERLRELEKSGFGNMRPEQLSVEQFVELTLRMQEPES